MLAFIPDISYFAPRIPQQSSTIRFAYQHTHIRTIFSSDINVFFRSGAALRAMEGLEKMIAKGYILNICAYSSTGQ